MKPGTCRRYCNYNFRRFASSASIKYLSQVYQDESQQIILSGSDTTFQHGCVALLVSAQFYK